MKLNLIKDTGKLNANKYLHIGEGLNDYPIESFLQEFHTLYLTDQKDGLAEEIKEPIISEGTTKVKKDDSQECKK